MATSLEWPLPSVSKVAIVEVQLSLFCTSLPTTGLLAAFEKGISKEA